MSGLAHIVPSLDDRHGGPSKSVRALANALARSGTSTVLLTTAEPGTASPHPQDDAAAIQVFDRTTPRSLGCSPGLAAHLAATDYDCLHYHSLWLLSLRYAHAASRRTGAPLVISPRGMMSEWAWSHHRLRKRFSEFFVHPGAFRAAAGWHATSPQEAADIRRWGFTQPVCVAPNGVQLAADPALAAARTYWHEALPVLRHRRVALFYSRFHRKKRLRELVDLWLSADRANWFLLIAGMPEEYSVAEISAWIASASGTDRAAVYDGTGRPPPYAVASLFLLPSHSENFGQVVAEALAAGVPALVTDTTPWRALASEQAGWCVSWPKFAPALTAALATEPSVLQTMGARGRAWMARDYSWERAAGLLREFYSQLRHG